MRARRYSRRTEQAYVDWVRRFILFHGKRHPRELGEEEILEFLSDLAVKRKVSAPTRMVEDAGRVKQSFIIPADARAVLDLSRSRCSAR